MGGASRGRGRTLPLSVFAAVLLAVVVAQSAFAGGRTRHAVLSAVGIDVVASSARPCLDAFDSGGSHQSPCSDAESCCILCSAVVCAASSAEAAAAEQTFPSVSFAARLLLAALERRPAGLLSSWSAQAPPSLA
jgi:hypothetical protein